MHLNTFVGNVKQSRYYSPIWGRLFNADAIVGQPGVLLSSNMFAYCVNNPILLKDPDGFRPMEGCTPREEDIAANERLRQNLGNRAIESCQAAEESGTNFPLWAGSNYREDNTNTPQGKHMHVFNNNKSEGSWSQNQDGSLHDEGSNSPGEPPKKVKKKLKEKTGWDWDKKKKQYEEGGNNTANTVVAGIAVTGGAYITYRVIRFIPSLAPPLWWTIPENLAIP